MLMVIATPPAVVIEDFGGRLPERLSEFPTGDDPARRASARAAGEARTYPPLRSLVRNAAGPNTAGYP
jgi:hypothetical protein